MIKRSLLALLLAGCARQAPVEDSSSVTESGAGRSAEGYVIRLDRGHEVGERVRWEQRVENTEVQRTLVGGQVADERSSITEGRLLATVEVKEVDTDGHAIVAEFTIEQLRVDRNGQVMQLQPGTLVTVTRSNDPGARGFAIGGEPVDESTDELLDVFLSKKLGGDVNGVFGSATPRAVGSTWPMDVDRFLADFADRGIPVTLVPESVEGAAELVAIEDLDGTEVFRLVLGSTGQIANIEEMPGEVTGGQLTMGVEGLWPTDGVSPQRAQTTTMTMELEATGDDPQVGAFTLQIGFSKSEERTLTPL